MVNSDYKKYFEYDKFVTKEQYIKELLTAPNGRKAQMINFDINYVDDRFAKTLTKIYYYLTMLKQWIEEQLYHFI